MGAEEVSLSVPATLDGAYLQNKSWLGRESHRGSFRFNVACSSHAPVCVVVVTTFINNKREGKNMDEIRFEVGECPLCERSNVPLRMIRGRNEMVAWICDLCISKWEERGGNGGVRAR